MSEQNIELVRDFYTAINNNLERDLEQMHSYASQVEKGELDEELRRVLDKMDQDIRWKDILGELRIGKLAWAHGADEALAAVDQYRIGLGEIQDLPDDRVLVELRGEATGRSSGVEGVMPFFAVLAVRNALITNLDEYPTRSEALKAAGLEQ